MSIILAIDPGLTGALAFLETTLTDRVSVYDMPVVDGEVNPHGLMQLVTRWEPSYAIIERVGPMPRDGVRQAWRFSASYATAKTVLALHMMPIVLVTPSAWKASMKVKGGPEGKEHCRRLALEMFPANAEHFLRKKDQGRAEAALLAVYGARLRQHDRSL